MAIIKKKILIHTLIVFLAINSAQCSAPSPEIIVKTVEVEVPVEKEIIVTKIIEKIVTEVVSVEVEITPIPKKEIEFWTTDTGPQQLDVYESVASRWMVDNPEYTVRIVPISEIAIVDRLSTAFTSERKPDIVRIGVENIFELIDQGYIDEDAAQAVIDIVGKDDFRTGSLALVTNPLSGKYAAVPYDGEIHGIWFRSDLFDEGDLSPPNSWDAINEACDALPDMDGLIHTLGLGTDPNNLYGHQIFEQVAISNNAWPFDDSGNITMDSPEMIETLKFYTDLQRCAIPGPGYWAGAREAYELNETGMLFYSTSIMDDLVEGSGLESGENVQIAVEDLALKTGFAPEMEGPKGSASYGQLMTLTLIQGAEPAAQDLVSYFLTEGYQDILGLAPFEKIPVTKSGVEGWKGLSPFFEYYSDETLDQIASGYDSMQRWLFRPDYDATQTAVIRDIESRLLIPHVISNIALEGTMTPETGAQWLQEQVEIIYAGYQQ